MDNALPTGWVITSLAETCQIIMGQSPPSETYNEEGIGLPFFQGKTDFGVLYPTTTKWCSEPNKIAELDDILISVRAPVGPTNLAKERCCIGRGLAALRPEFNMASRYFLYFLRYVEKTLAEQGTGTTFTAISGDVLRQQEIPLAPIEEQKRIVDAIEALFTELDAGIAALKRLRRNLKRYKASVLKAACEGRLVPQDPDDEPASELLKRILAERRAKWAADLRTKGKDPKKVNYEEPAAPDTEDLPELPEGWTWSNFDLTANVQGGIQKQPLRTPKNNAYPYLRVANVLRGKLDLSEISEFELFGDELEKLRLQFGDLLIVEGNGSPDQIGRCAIWMGEIENCVHQNHIIRARFKGIAPKYVSYYLNSPKGIEVMMQTASSTSGLHTLSVSKVKALVFPLPPGDEQKRIIEEVERLLTIIEELEKTITKEIRRADRLRQSILKQAFSGQLVPQDPNDEPASVLLERIRKARAGNSSAPKRNTRKSSKVSHHDE